MSSENPFRVVSDSARVELRCPYCERNLYIAPPDASVSLTACPHLDCQHVALVCTGEATDLLSWETRDGCVAMTLEHFVDPPSRILSFDAIDAMFILVGFILYIVAPLTMWAYAWRDLNLLLMVVVLTGPAALIGLGALVGIVEDVRTARRVRRRLKAVRRHAFARARWQMSRVRPQGSSHDR
jgi:hypothetical protein